MGPENFVLVLREVAYHPKSYLTKLVSQFEVTSVVHVRQRDELRKYSKSPLFDEKYLLIFEDLKLLVDNKPFIVFETMFPVLHVESVGQLEDAQFVLNELGLPFKVFNNVFTREDAYAFIQEKASEHVSDSFCKAVVRQVGLSPIRIMTALGVCEQVGYKESVLESYVDKWVYPDVRKLIECLLGVPRSKSAIRKSLLYLKLNRYWYRYVQRTVLDELDTLLKVYTDKIQGRLSSDSIFAYTESEHVTRSRVMFALGLFERVSITSVFALREYMKIAPLMDVVLRLSGGI